MFLHCLPAAALADLFDRRRLLVPGDPVITRLTALFALLMFSGHVTPAILLGFVFSRQHSSSGDRTGWERHAAKLERRPGITFALGLA